MFENNGQICVFSTMAGIDSPSGNVFHKYIYLVNLDLCCKFFPLNDFVTGFPIQTCGRPNLILA